nr:MAG TPA: hypothetical protein [Caudoviricetes sp.]
MRSTKQYGLVNSWQEHQALVKAEHTYERKHKHDEMVSHNSDSDVRRGKTSTCH